jgi:hypothetical protein
MCRFMRHRVPSPFSRRLAEGDARPIAQIAQMLRAILAAVPIAALTVAVPLVNRVEPRIFGVPFLLAWTVAWVLFTPAFLWTIGRIERRW